MAKTILPAGSYIYSPSIQQVDFTNFTTVTGAVFDFTRLYAIIDVTAGQIIYTTSGTSSGYGGNYAAPTLFLSYNTTGFSGPDLQIIYDLASTPSATYDGTGTQPILSTTDSITGREGLDINLLNSSFGGQLGWPLPSSTTSGYNDALSVGFINGGNLVAPTMDPMTNNLVVDINSFPSTGSSLPVTITGSSIIQPIDMTYVAGSPVSTSNPLPTGLASSSGSVIDYNQGASSANTIRTASNQYTSSGTAFDYGAGQTTSGTQRTVQPDYTVSGPSGLSGLNTNILLGSSAAFVTDGYRFASIQINSTATGGSYIFEGSNDNTTFFNIPVYNSVNPSASPVLGSITPIASSVTYQVPITFRWLRVRINVALTGGSVQSYSRFSQVVPPLLYNSVAVTSSALPTGASTETTLSAINTKIPALGSNLTALSTPVNIAYDQIVPIAPNGPTTFGTINTLNGFTVVNVAGYTACAIDIRGTFTATVSFQGSLDGTNWILLQAIPYGSAQNVALVSSTTTAGAWQVQCAGCVQVRAIATAYTSGTITTVVRATPATAWTYNAPLGATNSVAIASGTITTVSTVTSVSSVSGVASANISSSTTTDIASGAITTTTTSANISTNNIQSVAFQVAVTAVTGTTPTLDVVIQETMDGTNYYDIYHFERITATGSFYSPVMKLAGIGFRYVRTVAGTSPSFTMSVTRISRSGNASLVRRLFNRTIDPNTTGSASSSLLAEGTNQPYLVVSLGAGGTGGSPVFGIQGSEDGSTWYTIAGSTVTVATNSIGHANPLQGHLPKFIRAAVTSGGGSGYTLNYASIKSMGQ